MNPCRQPIDGLVPNGPREETKVILFFRGLSAERKQIYIMDIDVEGNSIL
jgi:hypothetical protein